MLLVPELLKLYKPTRQLHSSSDTSILCLPSVHTHLPGQRSFSYATLSGTVFLAKKGFETHLHLSNHLWSLTSSSCLVSSVYVCVLSCSCVCVCVCMVVCACVCLFWQCFGSLLHSGLCAPIWKKQERKKKAHNRVHHYYYQYYAQR